MALRFAFILLFSVCAFGAGIAAPAFPMTPEEAKCGPNQEFRSCGSACVPDCANPEEPKFVPFNASSVVSVRRDT